MKQVTLYCRQGSSDKVYQASIAASGAGYVVNFAYGRRGSTLKTGTKTPAPVDLGEAEKILDRLVREKKSGGYTEGEHGTPYAHTDKEQQVTGVLPQLLNPIDNIEPFLRSNEWCMQEKFDGKRILLRKTGRVVEGINRKGLTCGLPEPIVNAALAYKCDFIID